MPEILEVEAYRALAEPVVGRRITAVVADDPWFCKGVTPEELKAAGTGATITGTARRGKLMALDLDNGHRIGLRFGMTGRLVVDDRAAIDELIYGSRRDERAWDRFALGFARGTLRLNDPRRLGGVSLDPDLERLGPDALTLARAQLARALGGSAPLKAALMDQTRIAGLGNLLTDEALWRAGLAPDRPAGGLEPAELAALSRAIRTTLRTLARRGGSHTGDLQEQRQRGGICPRDGAVLTRATVGGRTTYWCPLHQS